MRLALIAALLLPWSAAADVIAVTAPPTAVTVYAQGALVHRTAAVDLPQGRHRIDITDMDPDLAPRDMDVRLSGVTILSRTWTPRPAAPYRTPRTAAWRAAKAALDAATDTLAQRDDAIALAEARSAAAQDQIRFLNSLSAPADGPLDVATLRAIGQLIASDGSAARGAVQAAQAEIRTLRQTRPDLVFAVAEAQAALDAVTPANTAPATLSLEVQVPDPVTAALDLRYFVYDAQWAPIYTVHLQDDATVTVDRGAVVSQFGAEDWRDVTLSLSTLMPSGQVAASTLRPLKRRIEDPKDAVRPLATRSLAQAAPMALDAVIAEESAATAQFDGVGVRYVVAHPVTVRAGADAVQVALDTLRFDTTVRARAIPRHDDVAYRLAAITNTSPEILLHGTAQMFVDGQLVGRTQLDTLPPGAETDMFFGAIDGLRLTRTVLNRNEGDRGLITRSNETREAVRLDIENLTDTRWQVAVREAVPFSEQEDLEITWTARPAPDTDAEGDRRGILEWQLAVAPGETQSISVETELQWPEGMVLR